MTRREKILLSLLVVAALGGVATFGVFGLFSATTQNAGNEIVTGTVSFSDNDSGSALYSATGFKPGDAVTRCIQATYTGSLAADVRIYTTSAPDVLAQHLNLTITPGTQPGVTFPSCAGFVPASGGAIFTGTLQAFEQTRTGFASGVATTPAGQAAWNRNDAVVYRLELTLSPATPDSAQGASSGVHTFIWEARNR